MSRPADPGTAADANVRQDIVICMALAAAVAAAYAPLWDAGFAGLDDHLYVSGNPHVQQGLTREGVAWALGSTKASNWHPLTWLSLMLDCQLFGAGAGSHHLVNVGFHVANSVLLFLVLRRMTGRRWPSALVVALFALHPLHVESVAWVAERKDVLSTLFWILTMGAYVRYARRPGVLRYLPVFAFLLLGLMAKPMLVTLPFVLLLLDYWPLGRLARAEAGATGLAPSGEVAGGRRAKVWRLVLEKVPLLVLAAASCVVTFAVQRHGEAVMPLERLALPARMANAAVSCVAYLGKMVWPQGLTVLYPYPADRPAWEVAAAAAFLLAVTAAAAALVRRRPYLAVGWFWYLGTLVPVIGLVQVGEQPMADRYTYVPLIGTFIMVAWAAGDLAGGGGGRDRRGPGLSCPHGQAGDVLDQRRNAARPRGRRDGGQRAGAEGPGGGLGRHGAEGGCGGPFPRGDSHKSALCGRARRSGGGPR
jgi:hypothetical protein